MALVTETLNCQDMGSFRPALRCLKKAAAASAEASGSLIAFDRERWGLSFLREACAFGCFTGSSCFSWVLTGSTRLFWCFKGTSLGKLRYFVLFARTNAECTGFEDVHPNLSGLVHMHVCIAGNLRAFGSSLFRKRPPWPACASRPRRPTSRPYGPYGAYGPGPGSVGSSPVRPGGSAAAAPSHAQRAAWGFRLSRGPCGAGRGSTRCRPSRQTGVSIS